MEAESIFEINKNWKFIVQIYVVASIFMEAITWRRMNINAHRACQAL